MKGKRIIAGILLVGILAGTLTGCRKTEDSKEETDRPVITLGRTIIRHTIISMRMVSRMELMWSLRRKPSKEWGMR